MKVWLAALAVGVVFIGTGIVVSDFAMAAASGCGQYGSGKPAHAGFGQVARRYTQSSDPLLYGACANENLTVYAGNSSQTLIWHTGFTWSGTEWIAHEYAGTAHPQSSLWLRGTAQKNLPRPQSGHTYVIAYVCEPLEQGWRCGCNNNQCATTNVWTLQRFTRTGGIDIGGTAQDDDDADELGDIAVVIPSTADISEIGIRPTDVLNELPSGNRAGALQQMREANILSEDERTFREGTTLEDVGVDRIMATNQEVVIENGNDQVLIDLGTEHSTHVESGQREEYVGIGPLTSVLSFVPGVGLGMFVGSIMEQLNNQQALPGAIQQTVIDRYVSPVQSIVDTISDWFSDPDDLDGDGVSDTGTDGDPDGGGVHDTDNPPSDPSCFTGETPVLMADGTLKPIKNISIGEKVMAFNSFGILTPQPVLKTWIHYEKSVIAVNGVQVTPEHRFLTPSGEYRHIGDLVIGDYIVTAEGEITPITSIHTVPGTYTVYNLTVATFHTYVAGGYRVHNFK